MKILDTIVLLISIPEHGLEKGDLGAVVEIYPPDGLEVEFIMGSGKTLALLTLNEKDRSISDTDVLSVRSENAA